MEVITRIPPVFNDRTIVKDTHSPGAPRTGSCNSASWNVYLQGRPSYPHSLERLIMSHHQQNSGNFTAAHDMGAGMGVYGRTLARYFPTVHVSDVNAATVAAAKEKLTAWKRKTQWRGRFSFVCSRAEQAYENLAPGSFDLVMMLESAHWTDAEAMVRSAATMLAPNGTLALAYYHPIPRIRNNEVVDAAVQILFDAWARRPMEAGRPATRHGQKQINLGLDFVPLPEDLFDRSATRRINVNSRGKGSRAFLIPGYAHLLPDPEQPETLSKMASGEEIEEVADGDEEAAGWTQSVTAQFFRNEMASIVHSEAMLQSFEPLLVDVEEAIRATSPSGFVEAEWTVAIVLATRR